MSAYNAAHQRQIDAQCEPEPQDDDAAYAEWCDARSHCDEVDAMRDFLMQHKRVTGAVLTTTCAPWPHARIATVQTDSFAEWTAWDKRVNWRNREVEA